MNSWANDSLREAIDCLARSGHVDLASDLSRIYVSTDLSVDEIFRSTSVEAIADALIEVDSLADLNNAMRAAIAAFGVTHCTFHVVKEARASFFRTQALTTYPKEWIHRYVEAGFQKIDPVMAACEKGPPGFYWDALDTSAPIVATFMKEALRCGVGPSGYTSITRVESGDVFAVSVCSSLDAGMFREGFEGLLQDFEVLSFYLSEAFVAVAGTGAVENTRPTDDQLRVLRGIAEGMSWEELERMEMRYGSFKTVSKSLRTMFHATTLMQAAVQAARIGLIDTAPFNTNNVLSSVSQQSVASIARSDNVASLRRYAKQRKRNALTVATPACEPMLFQTVEDADGGQH